MANEKLAWFAKNTELPAGLILIPDKSPPSAPNAPLNAVNRAVPCVKFVLYLRASVMFCAEVIDKESTVMIKKTILFIGFRF